jgi:hypothetical protein
VCACASADVRVHHGLSTSLKKMNRKVVAVAVVSRALVVLKDGNPNPRFLLVNNWDGIYDLGLDLEVGG